jgi:hypothetical protein
VPAINSDDEENSDGGESSEATDSSTDNINNNNHDTVEERVFSEDFRSWAIAFLRERASLGDVVVHQSNPQTTTSRTIPSGDSAEECPPVLSEDPQ